MAHTLDEDEIDKRVVDSKVAKDIQVGKVRYRYYVTLFEPKSKKDMKVMYPELNKYDEFADLGNKKMTFVWLIANKTSPMVIAKLDMNKRIHKGIISSGIEKDLSVDEIAKWKIGNFPDEIKLAIKRMEIFDPEIRARAVVITEKIFQNYELILNDEVTEDDGLEERSAYIDIAEKARKGLIDLVSQIELSYGIEIKKEKIAGTSEGNLMDRIIDGE